MKLILLSRINSASRTLLDLILIPIWIILFSGLITFCPSAEADLILDPSQAGSKDKLKSGLKKKMDSIKKVETKMERKWFDHADHNLVEIRYFNQASDKSPAVKYEIKSKAFIDFFKKKISSIPAEGEMMISFAPTVQLTEVIFTNTEKRVSDTVEFYDGRAKTPATSFHMNSSNFETQTKEILEGLTKPEFSKKIAKVDGLELNFKSFSLTYLGLKHTDGAPATVSFTTHRFKVTSLDGKESVELEVVSGQTPPKDKNFTIGGQNFILVSMDQDKQLHPDFFMILQQK